MKIKVLFLAFILGASTFARSMAPCDIMLMNDVKEAMANDLGVSTDAFEKDYFVTFSKSVETPVRLKIYTAIFTNDTVGGRGRPLHYVFKMSNKKPLHVFGCDILGMISPLE